MSRLAATLRCDVRLQARNGFYWAVVFLLTLFVVLVWLLPDFNYRPVIPPLLLGNLVLATYMFVAGLVLLEKDEGTLAAQAVTPLAPGEYLASKVATLTGLSLFENVAIALVLCGPGLRWLPLALGIVLASALYCLGGFLTIARYESINEFLFPSMLYITFFSLPILDYAGLWSTPLMYLHPLQAPLVLFEAAVAEVPAWQWVYGIGYSCLWIALASGWSRKAYRRFVAEQTGAFA